MHLAGQSLGKMETEATGVNLGTHMAHFTVYWVYSGNYGLEGEIADLSFSNVFKSHGVQPGDDCFILTNIDGRPHLVGHMRVKEIIVGKGQIRRAHLVNPLGKTEAIRGNNGTTIRFDRPIPRKIAKQLRFKVGGSTRTWKWRSDGRIDPQTMTGIRHLTPQAAALLNALLSKPGQPTKSRPHFAVTVKQNLPPWWSER